MKDNELIVLEISMIHITQGKRKTNTGLIGRKNGWKIPIIGNLTGGI